MKKHVYKLWYENIIPYRLFGMKTSYHCVNQRGFRGLPLTNGMRWLSCVSGKVPPRNLKPFCKGCSANKKEKMRSA